MKNIKSISTCCLALGAALFFSFSAMAAVISAPGGNIAAASAPTAEPDLNVKLSPGVQLNYVLNATAGELGSSFTLNSWNTNVKADSGNRNEYGIASDYAGYYMRPVATTVTGDLPVPTADDSAAFNTTGWVKQ